MKIPAIMEKERPTAKPSNLKGSNINHINGYKNIAKMAKGQQITNKIHQSKNFKIGRAHV